MGNQGDVAPFNIEMTIVAASGARVKKSANHLCGDSPAVVGRFFSTPMIMNKE